MPHLMRTSLAVIACLAGMPQTGTAQVEPGQGNLARCTAATPQFPLACGCVIARAEAAGITGPTLSRLLANDIDGVPIETFQSYGAIYVQCIQEAVLAGVPAAPKAPVAPLPVVPVAPLPVAPVAPPPFTPVAPPPPAPPPPAPSSVPSPVPSAPVAAAPVASFGGDAPVLTLADGQAPGQWGDVVLDHRFGGRLLSGTHDAQGRIVAALCDFDRSLLVLAGSGVRAATPRVEVTALAGSGAEIVRRTVPGLSLDGDRIVMPLFADLETGIRRGATLRLAVEGGPLVEVGLDGSNGALGPGRCGVARLAFDRYLVSDYDRPGGVWLRVEGGLAAQPGPYLEPEAQAPFVPTLALSCERRLVVRSPVFGYGGPGEMVLTPGTAPVPLDWQLQGGMLLSPPLSDDLIAAMASATGMTLTVHVDVEPGEHTTVTYPMAGFAEGLADLSCPPAAQPPAADVVGVAIGTGQPWAPGDLAQIFGGREPFVIVSRSFGAVAPQVSVTCDGLPQFLSGDWGEPGESLLRITVDDDPSTTRDVPFSAARGVTFPDRSLDDLTGRILDGGTLRVTALADPARDVVYALDGVGAALARAGCRF